ncbi:MAG: YbgC/FadM family acyl-CoA thioesterase [Anaerolineales bacterium]|nr:YbgC/FadM family acyl-CoA thioesterase [Anaerolineales bacterium]
MPTESHLPVHVYYEDTDFSGVVYHANYLKFFERAREHAIGPDRLVWLWDEHGLGFVVYQLEMKFDAGARFGELLDIRSSWEMNGKYRMVWQQAAWRPGGEKAAVSATIQLVCIDQARRLQPIPLPLLDAPLP